MGSSPIKVVLLLWFGLSLTPQHLRSYRDGDHDDDVRTKTECHH